KVSGGEAAQRQGALEAALIQRGDGESAGRPGRTEVIPEDIEQVVGAALDNIEDVWTGHQNGGVKHEHSHMTLRARQRSVGDLIGKGFQADEAGGWNIGKTLGAQDANRSSLVGSIGAESRV